MLTQLKAEQLSFSRAAVPLVNAKPEAEMVSPSGTVERELQLLLACARVVLDEKSTQRIRTLMQGAIDWTYVVEQAEQHRVLPLLFQSLSEACPELVPPHVLKELRDYSAANAHYNLFRTGELINLLRLFESNGIPALPFKGPVLSASAYGNLGLRQYADLDILVRRQDVLRTRALLLGQGYQSITPSEAEPVDLSRRRKDLIFESWDNRVRVELHWRLTGLHFDFPLDLDSVWDGPGSVSLAGSKVRALTSEDLLLYLCVHGSRHGWERLLWICDVAELLRTHTVDWKLLTDKARKLGSRRTLALGLILVRDLLGVDLQPDVWRRVEVEPCTELLALRLRESLFRHSQCDRGISYWHDIHLHMRERLSDRLRLRAHYYRRYLRLAWVPNERDRAIVELPARLSFLYYLLRPLRLVRSFGLPQFKKWPAAKDGTEKSKSRDPEPN